VALEYIETLQKKNSNFKAFLLERALAQECRGLPLSSFLIKPVQRICKYPLLLRELLRFTPQEHPDFEGLTKSFNKINEVVLVVNEGQRAQENKNKILDIQKRLDGVENFGQLVGPSRRLVLEGILQELNPDGSSTPVHYFLFNDLLVRAVPRRHTSLKDKLLKKKLSDTLTISAWINGRKLNVQSEEDTGNFSYQSSSSFV
jgi:hypothetical protein